MYGGVRGLFIHSFIHLFYRVVCTYGTWLREMYCARWSLETVVKLSAPITSLLLVTPPLCVTTVHNSESSISLPSSRKPIRRLYQGYVAVGTAMLELIISPMILHQHYYVLHQVILQVTLLTFFPQSKQKDHRLKARY